MSTYHIRQTEKRFLLLSGMLSFGTAMTFATYVTFLLQRGMSYFEVGFVNVLFFTAMLIFEVPTGIFADTWGRRRSFSLACLMYATGTFLYSQSYTFAGFVLAEIIAGIGRTFANGAFHSWAIDRMKHYGNKERADTLFRKEEIQNYLVIAAGTIIGGFIGSYDIALPWIVESVIILATGITAFVIMKEEYRVNKKRNLTETCAHIARTHAVVKKEYGWSNPLIRFILILGILLSFCVQPLNMYWQPYFGNVLSDKQWVLGFIGAAMMIFLMFGSWISKKISARITCDKSALAVCHMAIGLAIVAIIASQAYALMALAWWLIHEIPRSAISPIKNGYVNEHIPSTERATIASYISSYSHLASVGGLVIFGIVTQRAGITTAWTCSGILLVTVSASLFISTRIRSHRKGVSETTATVAIGPLKQ